jgi:hypothetical protein
MINVSDLAAEVMHYNDYTAVGDSYSSGDGALKGWGVGKCKRNQGAHGPRLNTLLKPDKFQFSACSGADVPHIRKQLNGSHYGEPDLITMTATGDNEGMFVKVLLACFVKKNAKRCDAAVEFASGAADRIPETLAPLYADIRARNAGTDRNQTIIHLGYAALFNRDADYDNCPVKPLRIFRSGVDVRWATRGPGGYREKINNVILKVNSKIKESADAAGVTFVDVDPYFEGHRFCDGPTDAWMQHHLNFKEDGVLCHPTFEGHGAYIKATLVTLLKMQLSG